MIKQILSEEFRRMQKLAGLITEVNSGAEENKPVTKEQKLKDLVSFFSQGGVGDEKKAIRDTYLHFQDNGTINTLEPYLQKRYLNSLGIFNFKNFTEKEFNEIVEKLAKEKDDDSFLKDFSL